MEGFSYVDIFDTKGIEYLIVIGFLLLIIPTWILLNKPVQVKNAILNSLQILSVQLLKIPRGLFYNKKHTWVYMEKSGDAKIGIDDLLLHLTGGVSVNFRHFEGDIVKKGEILASINRGERKLQITSPISGQIIKVNKLLQSKEGTINEDPYDKGWLTTIKPVKWKEEIKDFVFAEEAENWAREELERCKDFLLSIAQKSSSSGQPLVLQEGGEISDFPMAEMPLEIWNKFQQEFLT